MKNIFLFSFAALALSACVPSADTQSPDLTRAEGEYAKATCLFRGDEGSQALDYLAQKRQVIKAAFGKEFNFSKFSGIGSASADESLRYIQKMGLNVFKLSSDGYGCNLLHEALEMPTRVLEFWNRSEEAVIKVAGDGKKDAVRLMGLYVGETTQSLADAGESKPFIIVRENSTRWTLVHEFMHHLFMERALEQEHNDFVMKRRMKEAIQALIQISDLDLKSMSGLKRAVRTLVRFIKINDETLLHYSFEEMAIEDQLRKAYEAKALRFVTPYDYDSAAWYIKFSAGNFGKIKRESETFISTLRSSAYEVEMTDEEKAEILNDLEIAKDILNKREDQIQELKDRNLRTESNLQTGATGVLKKKVLERHKACSHADIEKDLISNLKKINQRFHK